MANQQTATIVNVAWVNLNGCPADLLRFRTATDIYGQCPKPDISGLLNATTLRMVVNGRARPDLQAPQLCSPTYPRSQAYKFTISSVTDRMFMVIIGRKIAENTASLFCCTQIGKISNAERLDVMDPTKSWDNDEMLDKIARIMNASPVDAIPPLDIFKKMYPMLDTFANAATLVVGDNVCVNSIYMPARVDENGVALYDPAGAKRLPVIIMRPLRHDTRQHAGDDWGRPFEWHQIIIAGDVLIISYCSEDCSISFAHSAAIQTASEHGIQFIRAIIAYDTKTGEVVITDYYIPVNGSNSSTNN